MPVTVLMPTKADVDRSQVIFCFGDYISAKKDYESPSIVIYGA